MTHDNRTLDSFLGDQDEAALIAKRGEPLPEGASVANKEAVVEALRTVFDPEIPVNIYDLGLIYEIDIDAAGNAKIKMSLTAPGCPVAGQMPVWVADAASSVEGIGKAEATIVWEPAWSPDLMSEDAKLALGIF